MKAAQGGSEESEKLNKMSSLLERLHVKFSPNNRPWTETMKLVRQVMEKRVVMNSGGHQNLVSCLETLQKALKVTTLPAMTDRLESIARQNGLGSHLSANGTECYITSDMFYVEVHLDPAGQLCDVKVAHHGENPVSCPELVQHLRDRNFDEFSKHLKGLVNLYKLPGDNKLKTKMYLALQSLELDLSKMAGMYWQATNASPLDKILHGSVGYLTPRSGGHLMNLKYYVSPYDLLEEGTGASIVLSENNVPRDMGMNVYVTIEGTLTMNKLLIAPLIMGSHPVDNKGYRQEAIKSLHRMFCGREQQKAESLHLEQSSKSFLSFLKSLSLGYKLNGCCIDLNRTWIYLPNVYLSCVVFWVV